MKAARRKRFDFEGMKAAATHESGAIRKQAFIEYFEQFSEFPSYLFDNASVIDKRLFDTMQDILKDPETSKAMREGVNSLLLRLPS